MKLFFDTETSGKANFKLPATHPSQPRLVQLAAALTDDAGNEISTVNMLVRPEGWTISAEAQSKHGISTEFAIKHGLPVKAAVATFCYLARAAASVHAFNLEFDRIVMRGEIARIPGMPQAFDDIDNVCEMLAMKSHCRIPGKFGDFKWPSLQEAHQHACGKNFEGAHDALVDIRAMINVHKWRMVAEAPKVEQRKPRFHALEQIGKLCPACECKIDFDGCGCNPPGA